MPICRIKQVELFPSGVIDDTLDPLNAPTSANLEEDLNYIRSVIRSLFGTTHWYEIPPGNLNDIMNDFPIQHYTTSEDPTKAGYHKDIIADSASIVNGNLSVSAGDVTFDSGNFTISSGLSASLSVSDYLLNTNSGTYTLLTGDQSISASSITATVSGNYTLSNGTNNWLIFNPSEYIQFNGTLSTGNLQIDLQQGYGIYSDNEGPRGENPGTRLWINTPDGNVEPAGIVLGPRSGASYASAVRIRSNQTRLEGSSDNLLLASTTLSSTTADAFVLLARITDGDSTGLSLYRAPNSTTTGTNDIVAFVPTISGSTSFTTAHFLYDTTVGRWKVRANSTFYIETPNGAISMGAMNTSYGHIYTDRPLFWFSKPISVNGGVRFYNVDRNKEYRIYIGSTFPVTPQEGDIWIVT